MGEFNGDVSEHEERSARAEIEKAAEVEGLKAGLAAAKEQVTELAKEAKGLRADLEEAVELAHKLLAKRFPAFPYFGKLKGNPFLLGRDLLRKHGRLQDE